MICSFSSSLQVSFSWWYWLWVQSLTRSAESGFGAARRAAEAAGGSPHAGHPGAHSRGEACRTGEHPALLRSAVAHRPPDRQTHARRDGNGEQHAQAGPIAGVRCWALRRARRPRPSNSEHARRAPARAAGSRPPCAQQDLHGRVQPTEPDIRVDDDHRPERTLHCTLYSTCVSTFNECHGMPANFGLGVRSCRIVLCTLAGRRRTLAPVRVVKLVCR
jgi:hypothetical protein